MAGIVELVEENGREATIDLLVATLDMSRGYAEFVVAMSLGENEGDVVKIDNDG